MKRSPRPTRTPANLPESVNQQLNTYALAATAAGVGMLTLAQPAEAKIIYTRVNDAIPRHEAFNLDLNHDGKADFYFYIFSSYHRVNLAVDPLHKNNNAWGTAGLASDLQAGVRVGGKGQFQQSNRLMASFFSNTSYHYAGQWLNAQHRYLGLKFMIQGQVHFGWARLNVSVRHDSFSATLTGYAYETIPNKPILTGDILGETKMQDEISMEQPAVTAPPPEPMDLGLLALGSRGFITGKTKGPDDISVGEPDAALTMPTPEPVTLGTLAMGAPGLSIWRR